ncbi:MAG: DUF481 domain-containing protein [bacterium]
MRSRAPGRIVLFALVPLLALTLSVEPAGAQIVNIESILAGEPSPGVEGALSAGFDLSRGNSRARRLDGNGLVRWRRGDLILQLVAGGAYSEAGGVKVAENALGHLRLGWQTSRILRLEALLQVQQDTFIRLHRRVLTGAGLRLALYEGEKGVPGDRRLDAGLILMHEEERLRDRPRPDPRWRVSVLLSTSWVLNETVEVGAQVYLQPLLDEPGDHRVLGDAGIMVRLLGPLSLQVQARVVHDSRPPTGVEPTDLTLRNVLGITF